MKYKGYGNGVNEKPEGEWIEIFVSDCSRITGRSMLSSALAATRKTLPKSMI